MSWHHLYKPNADNWSIQTGTLVDFRAEHVYLHYCARGLTSSKAADNKRSPGHSGRFQHRWTHASSTFHTRNQTARSATVRAAFTPRSRGSRWTCSPCSKASAWWSRSPRSWCWLWIGATGWRSRRGRTGSGGPVRPRSAPRRSLAGTTGTFCSCCSSSCRVHRKMALCAGRGTMSRFIERAWAFKETEFLMDSNWTWFQPNI